MNTNVHAGIEYTRHDGANVHSDICPPGCSSSNMSNAEWRGFLHKALDEWLDKSNGTGAFYIREEGFEI